MTQILPEWFKQTEIWLIPEDWEVVELGELINISSSKRIFASEYIKTWIPFFRWKEIIELSKWNDISTELFISEDTYNEIKEKCWVPQIWDILLSSVWTLGVPYLITTNFKFYYKDWNITQLHSSKSDKISPNFLLYYVKSDNWKNEILWWSIGSTQQALTITSLKKVKLPLPPLPEQKAIAEILSSLDDKIELLEKQNKTLENIGQALFKSWFVDFEPFQNDLLESEMGMIPRGWKVGKVGDYTNIFTWRKNVNQANQEWEYRFFSCSPDTFFSDEFLYDWKAVLVAWNWSFTWRVAYYKWKFDLYQRTYALVKNDDIKFEFMNYLYFVMKYKFEPIFMWWSRGSSIPYIVMWDISNFEFFIPKQEKLAEFENIIDWFFDKMEANNSQIQTLSNLRNSLLPRLMSGKIRVV